jgi:hypothetical protein
MVPERPTEVVVGNSTDAASAFEGEDEVGTTRGCGVQANAV